MPTLPTMLTTDTDPLKSDQKPDAPTEFVSLAPLNVLLVLIPSITVPPVSKEELTHLSVIAQMVNMLTPMEFAKTVTLNVKLVTLMTLVLNVLTTLTELNQPIVHV